MSDMWEQVSDAGSPLLAPLPERNPYPTDDYPAWNICPICNSYNYACFVLPGVNDGSTPT